MCLDLAFEPFTCLNLAFKQFMRLDLAFEHFMCLDLAFERKQSFLFQTIVTDFGPHS